MAAEPQLKAPNPESPPPASPEDLDETSLEPEDDAGELPDSSEGIALDQQPVPKRKGGRKPIYATVEERKQRNRQAQAAFRERRSEYIKQLESTLKQYEDLLHLAQRDQQAINHQLSFMQRRIHTLELLLREKGIDTEAELQMRGEDAMMSADMPAMPSNSTDSPSGSTRRPAKQSGTTGNTKLDVLRRKSASVRYSNISPLSSPQSQSSLWNDATPSSPPVPSPLTDGFGTHFPTTCPPSLATLSSMHGFQPHHAGPPPSSLSQHGSRFGLEPAPGAPSLTPRSQGSLAAHSRASSSYSGSNWQGRFPINWSAHQDHISDPMQASDSPSHTRDAALPSEKSRAFASSAQPPERSEDSSGFTMPDGFSQEIFPLTYERGNLPFPDSAFLSTGKGADSKT